MNIKRRVPTLSYRYRVRRNAAEFSSAVIPENINLNSSHRI